MREIQQEPARAGLGRDVIGQASRYQCYGAPSAAAIPHPELTGPTHSAGGVEDLIGASQPIDLLIRVSER